MSGSVVGEDSSLHFTSFCSRYYLKSIHRKSIAAIAQARKEKTCADRLLPRNLSSFSRDRHCVLPRLAFVRVELLLNSRLPQLARVCRELRIAGFTNSARRDVADSFCNPKTALCHNSVSHSAGNCASLANLPPGETPIKFKGSLGSGHIFSDSRARLKRPRKNRNPMPAPKGASHFKEFTSSLKR